VALGKQLDEDENLVFVLMGDGEVQEGQVWEAAMFAGSKNVDNLIAIIDFNRKQIDGSTDDVMPLGDLKSKWETFGWKVLEMKGNDLEEVIDVLRLATLETGKDQPVMILMHTEMGFGVDFMMGTHKWHGVAPNDEQLQLALAQLNETIGDY
jgi:transketolase